MLLFEQVSWNIQSEKKMRPTSGHFYSTRVTRFFFEAAQKARSAAKWGKLMNLDEHLWRQPTICR